MFEVKLIQVQETKRTRITPQPGEGAHETPAAAEMPASREYDGKTRIGAT